MELTLNRHIERCKVERIEYIEFWVGNAKLCSKFYCKTFGFSHLALKGLETGERERASHVVVQNDAIFMFTSTYKADDKEFNEQLSIHGDFVKDVALRVENVADVYNEALLNGATGIEAPHEITDEYGTVTIAKICAPFGDTVHSLIDKSKYTGSFLPKFKSIDFTTKIKRGNEGITNIDHIALAYEEGKVLEALNWYIKCLKFQHFLCNDEDTQEGLSIQGKEGGLKTIVAATNQTQFALKFVFVEPKQNTNSSSNNVNQTNIQTQNIIDTDTNTNTNNAGHHLTRTRLKKLKKNQIQEFIEFNGNKEGVHHIALHTEDIIETVYDLKIQGIDFISVPTSYYDDLVKFHESDFKNGLLSNYNPKKLEELGILLDISYKTASLPNFILQTFTVPLQDRPTYFFEIISRKGSRGFGEKTIKALFEAIESLQQKR